MREQAAVEKTQCMARATAQRDHQLAALPDRASRRNVGATVAQSFPWTYGEELHVSRRIPGPTLTFSRRWLEWSSAEPLHRQCVFACVTRFENGDEAQDGCVDSCKSQFCPATFRQHAQGEDNCVAVVNERACPTTRVGLNGDQEPNLLMDVEGQQVHNYYHNDLDACCAYESPAQADHWVTRQWNARAHALFVNNQRAGGVYTRVYSFHDRPCIPRCGPDQTLRMRRATDDDEVQVPICVSTELRGGE